MRGAVVNSAKIFMESINIVTKHNLDIQLKI